METDHETKNQEQTTTNTSQIQTTTTTNLTTTPSQGNKERLQPQPPQIASKQRKATNTTYSSQSQQVPQPGTRAQPTTGNARTINAAFISMDSGFPPTIQAATTNATNVRATNQHQSRLQTTHQDNSSKLATHNTLSNNYSTKPKKTSNRRKQNKGANPVAPHTHQNQHSHKK